VIRRSRSIHQGGFAMVFVLWMLGLLGLLIAAILTNSRADIHVARDTRGSIVTEVAADGAVQRAIYLLLAGAMQSDGMPHQIAIGAARVSLTVADENQRINPNFSGPPLLAALLINAGLPPASALTLARRIIDWRTATPFAIGGGHKLDQYKQAGLPYGPPDRPFLTANEIGQVLGMTPVILAHILPFLSVYTVGDLRLSAQQVSTAGVTESILRLAQMINHGSILAGFENQDRVVQIVAEATTSGARYVRTAVVKLPRQAGGETPAWTILEWR
jgi:type II secretory pathway component PulK